MELSPALSMEDLGEESTSTKTSQVMATQVSLVRVLLRVLTSLL